MAINIYRRLPDIERAMKEVFTDSYDAEVRQPNMLIVLIHDFICQNNKLKIGGKLSRMVKDNEAALRVILGAGDEKKDTSHLPKYAYLRVNKILKVQEEKAEKKQKDGSDDSSSSVSSEDEDDVD